MSSVDPEVIEEIIPLIMDTSIQYDGRIAVANSRSIKAQMLPYQALLLYYLAAQYNNPGCSILEIGTAAGFSASILAQAAFQAKVKTLNSTKHEIPTATKNLIPFKPNDTTYRSIEKLWDVKDIQPKGITYNNIEILCIKSWEYQKSLSGEVFDMVYVDGDHKNVSRDIPFWDNIKPGGLMLFHDFSPEICPPVFREVVALAQGYGRDGYPDIDVVDSDGIGMGGVYKRG